MPRLRVRGRTHLGRLGMAEGRRGAQGGREDGVTGAGLVRPGGEKGAGAPEGEKAFEGGEQTADLDVDQGEEGSKGAVAERTRGFGARTILGPGGARGHGGLGGAHLGFFT